LGETQKGHEESLEKRGRRPKTTVLEKLFKSHKNDLGCKQKKTKFSMFNQFDKSTMIENGGN
jgi:hypothetical protein